MAQPKTQEELKRKQQEFLARVAAAKEKRGETLTEDDITIDKEYGKNLPTATVPSAPSAPTYTAPTYVESDIVKQAQAALNSQLANKPGAYQSQWQTQLNDVIGKILNREKFSYDLNGDALYQQMADEYSRRGNLAMMDTMGQAAAMTGGFGNSYAQSVGQQAYQAHLQELNEVIPEIYKMQLDKYNMEGQDLYNQYAMLGAEDDREYGQYRDEVADWLAERDYLADRYDSERNFDYGKYADDRDFGYGVYRDSMSDYQWQNSKVVGDTEDEEGIPERETPKDDEPKTWEDFSPEKLKENQEDYGGSYYSTVLNDLKQMKASGKSNAEANKYLSDLVANSYISRGDYLTLYNKYRDNKLG